MKTYYNDTEREVSFQNESLAKLEASDYFNVLTDHKESYMGFIDVYDEIIIFSWLEPDRWIIDHPAIPNTLHRQRYATKKDCLHIIEQLFQEKGIHRFPDFIEVPVQEFTLDEMLQFKKEDEALLNEEEISVEIAPAPVVAKPITKKPKKNSPPSMIMGEQLGIKKSTSAATSSQAKETRTPKPLSEKATISSSKPTSKTDIKPTAPSKPKSSKPSTQDDDSFFSL